METCSFIKFIADPHPQKHRFSGEREKVKERKEGPREKKPGREAIVQTLHLGVQV